MTKPLNIRRLKDIKTKEVSLVDRGANGYEFVMHKNAPQEQNKMSEKDTPQKEPATANGIAEAAMNLLNAVQDQETAKNVDDATRDALLQAAAALASSMQPKAKEEPAKKAELAAQVEVTVPQEFTESVSKLHAEIAQLKELMSQKDDKAVTQKSDVKTSNAISVDEQLETQKAVDSAAQIWGSLANGGLGASQDTQTMGGF